MIRSVSKNLKTFSFTKNNLRTFTNKIVYFFFLHKCRSLRQLFTIKKFMFEEWYLLEGHTNADRPEPTRQRPSFLAFPSAGKQTQTSLQNCYRGKEEISTQDHATVGGVGLVQLSQLLVSGGFRAPLALPRIEWGARLGIALLIGIFFVLFLLRLSARSLPLAFRQARTSMLAAVSFMQIKNNK